MKRNKFGAKKTGCAFGHVHDSRGEARHCEVLHARQKDGEITHLELQRKFRFSIDGRPVKLKNGHHAGINIDFIYRENGQQIAEDFKGFVVRDWPLRRAIFCALYPHIIFREVKAFK